MQKFLYYFSLYRKRILLSTSFLFVTLCILSFMLINNKFNAESITNDVSNNSIKVDVKGAVVNPGVYELDIGDRVVDAINKAGGFSLNAYQMNINLAKRLKDEAVIIVNTNEDIDYYRLSKVPVVCQDKNKFDNNGICQNYNIAEYNEVSNDNSSLNTLVNINTATLEELTSLEGIGEGKAIKIIEYRNSINGFNSIDELKNVEGIGDKLYEMVKNSITV